MKRLLVWGFAVELILVSAAYALLRLFVSPEDIATFVHFGWIPLLTLVGLIFAGQLGILVHYLQQGTTELGLYLRKRQVERLYTVAFVAPVGISVVGALLLCVAGYKEDVVIANLALCGAAYVVVSLATTISNAVGYMRLAQEFSHQLHQHKAAGGSNTDTVA